MYGALRAPTSNCVVLLGQGGADVSKLFFCRAGPPVHACPVRRPARMHSAQAILTESDGGGGQLILLRVRLSALSSLPSSFRDKGHFRGTKHVCSLPPQKLRPQKVYEAILAHKEGITGAGKSCCPKLTQCPTFCLTSSEDQSEHLQTCPKHILIYGS
jgi:hypothetical protein